jgi:tetratricopeptide (TPR) repeat protein
MYETIDNYFEGRLSATEHEAFERKLAQDKALADEVAFYLSTKAALKEANLQKRHAEWTRERPVQSLRWQWASGIAAAIGLLIVAWYFITPSNLTLQEYAEVYIEENLMRLNTHMDTSNDSLHTAIDYYNHQKYQEALPVFNRLAAGNPSAKAYEYEGLTQMQLQNYDAAIAIFEQMAADTELLENRGKFYAALAYLKKGDIDTAQRLLKEVIAQDLGGKAQAEQWLNTVQ